MLTPATRSERIKALAFDLGFVRTGVTAAAPVLRQEYLRRWLAEGRGGAMDYLQRNSALREDPRGLLEGARSIIVTAMNYHVRDPAEPSGSAAGRVARYAWGRDYHAVVRERLEQLMSEAGRCFDEAFNYRICVDTAPLLEREVASSAGIGWIGKNTMVLHQDVGSYFFLGEVITTLDLAFDPPVVDHCGTCRRCLDACPTQAFPAPYEMDASRCISYLTIELREEIPTEFHAAMGHWVYGCDICQEVCPYNHDAPLSDDPDVQIRPPGPSLSFTDVLNWTPADYRQRLHQSAMRRAKLEMLKRNVRIASQNSTPSE